MTSSHLTLGPYHLERPIGHGSYGQVWAAQHRDLGLPAALKVLTSKRAHNPDFRADFANEVRAMAGLEHPAILAVYDHGRVPKEAAERSAGRLSAGSPWLAMELATGGNLAKRADRRFDWSQVASWLGEVLSALAHAHARGLIHRDIKPSNILICGDDDLRPGLKLSDFDLARAMDDDRAPGLAEFAAGTPYYMAPEQCEGRWRDYGPWTDLYALGCVAFELVCAQRPFEGGSLEEVMAAHCRGERTAFAPRITVPRGLRKWLDNLLQRHHMSRYRCAADALGALLLLDEGAETEKAAAGTGDQSWTPSAGDVETEDSIPPWERSASDVFIGLPGPPQAPPPRTDDWRYGEAEVARRRSTRFAAIGLPLFHLRAHPVVDRVAERDALWRALAKVRQERRAQLVLLRGNSGTGKTALLRWLTERAYELGMSQVLRATHANTWGPSHGLPAMIARHLRCVGLSPRDAADHLRATLLAQGISDEGEWLALAELVSPGVAANRPKMSVRLANPTERYTVIRRALERISAERPVIVHLEDVQWGLESLGFVAHLLDAQSTHAHPILVVADVGNDELAERPSEAAVVDRLQARDDVVVLDIGPLVGEPRRALIRELVGLSGEVAGEVERRTAGNPLFVVQLVEDWITKGLLEPAPDGLRLREGVAVELPDSVHSTWAARVDRLLVGHPADHAKALELAAVLGFAVDTEQWRTACALLGVSAPSELITALLDARLAVPAERGPNAGFSFIHTMLRESLVRRAREGGYIEALHRACARMLQRRPGPGQAERLGLHLVAAGEAEAALGPLISGAQQRMDAGDCDAALGLLNRFDQALELAVDDPTQDPRSGESAMLRCDVLLLVGRVDEAEVVVAELADLASDRDWPSVLAGALIRQTEISRMRGDLAAAHEVVQPALVLAEQVGDPLLQGRGHFEQGWVYMRQGRFEEAKAHLASGFEFFIDGGEVARAGDCQMALANVDQQLGRLEEAAKGYERTHALYLEGGSRKGLIRLYVTRGEIARHRGQLDVAEGLYREALERSEAVGYGGIVWPLINLGLTLLQANRPAEAIDSFDRCLAKASEQRRRAVVGWTHLMLAACHAGQRNWAKFDEHLADGTAFMAETQAVELDVAMCAEQAASYALADGELTRARQALEVARAQWGGLGRTDDVARVDDQLAQLAAITD